MWMGDKSEKKSMFRQWMDLADEKKKEQKRREDKEWKHLHVPSFFNTLTALGLETDTAPTIACPFCRTRAITWHPEPLPDHPNITCHWYALCSCGRLVLVFNS
jgi:hypothetical protein